MFLFLLALVWSIDASLAYLLSGVSLSCFYLGFNDLYPAQLLTFRNFGVRDKSESQTRKDFSEERSDIIQKEQQHPVQKVPSTISRKAALTVVSGLIFFIFIVVFVNILSGNDDSDANFFFQQGDMFFNEGKYDSAKFYYRSALKIDENQLQAILGYGNTLMISEQNDSAIIMYDKAIALDPDFEQARYQKGLALSYQKSYDESIEELKGLVDMNSSFYEAMQVIGDDFYNQQKYDSAIRWYEEAYSSGLRNRYLCHLMAYIYDTKGNTSKAIPLYKEALEYDNSIVDIYIRLGQLLPGESGNSYREMAKELSQ